MQKKAPEQKSTVLSKQTSVKVSANFQKMKY